MKALIAAVSVAGLLLVGACGVSSSEPSQGNSAPNYRVVDRFTVPEFVGEVLVVCRHDDMYMITDTHYGINGQRIDNHEECK